MEDINLLPKDLRPKEKGKSKAPSEKAVDFIYPKKTSANKIEIEDLPKKQIVKDAGKPDKDAKLTSKPGQNFIKNKIQSALLIFKKLKISDLKKLPHRKKEKEAPKLKETGLSIDLLKEEISLRRSPKPELIKLFIIAAIVTLSFIGVLFYYKARYKRIQANIETLGLEIQNLDAELADLQAKQDSLRNSDKLIEAVYVLLKNRVNWMAFLKEIENKTLKTVYYTQLEAKDLNKISVTARAKSMEDCLKQINIFKASSDFAKDVVLARMDIKEEKINKEDSEETEVAAASIIEFSFEFKVNPEWIVKNGY